ncbi:Rus Holliday junction resolvase [uncultured Caudovirales phage]|uniref:Rus Holliday junction resolvase n=1 Tax=uncultured Caudovirales phage TaxID=2100421 RepID=A0A6J5PKX7_9CAUD|nr:Rus Holliday junction resolvase [uncultured Caudovirales phage]
MTTITLPYPPSANRYLRHTARGTYRTAEADRYCAAVKRIAAASAAGKHQGRVALLAKLHPKTTIKGNASETRMDLDNCLKVACDALQGVLYDNDLQIERISIEIGGPVIGGALSVEVLAITEGA